MTTSASARLPIPNRDYSILSPRQLRVMRQRSKPPEVDRSAEIAREQGFAKHQQTQQLASLWPNTIARNRIDKQTRLQREKEAEEERQKVIDAEEKKIQKLKRQAALAEASKAEFQQRPEVRAVNSQLLQFEVEQEREMQLTFKERARIAEMKQQIADDEARAKEHEEALAREEKIRRERRERALQLARDVKKQRDEREALRTQQAETDYEEELIIAAHMRKELEMEQEAILRAKQLARQQNEENLRENQQMQSYKESILQIIQSILPKLAQFLSSNSIDLLNISWAFASDILRSAPQLFQQFLLKSAVKVVMDLDEEADSNVLGNIALVFYDLFKLNILNVKNFSQGDFEQLIDLFSAPIDSEALSESNDILDIQNISLLLLRLSALTHLPITKQCFVNAVKAVQLLQQEFPDIFAEAQQFIAIITQNNCIEA